MTHNGEVAEHTLRLNDIDRTWVETRHYATEDGAGQFDVYVTVCSCGFRIEGRDGGDCARLFSKHVSATGDVHERWNAPGDGPGSFERQS